MSNLEFVERLPALDGEERWLIRSPDSELPRVAWLLSDDRSFLDAMQRDTSPWIGFSHPRVSQIFTTGWLGDRLLVTIDDDRGPTLADAAAQLGDTRVDLERWVVAQFIAIADGLATMARHSPAFVHRRLEPHRLFVDIAGHARLRAPVAAISFGEQRGYTGAGRITGSPEFMSPEQAMGMPLTAASDVFSLASNLAFAINGVSPFHADSMLDSLGAIIRGPAPIIETHTAGLDVVFARAFAREPRERYRDPAAFAAALRACVRDADDYDACTSDRIAVWWPTADQALGPNELLGDRCAMQWDQLTRGDNADIRHCGGCQQPVVRVSSLAAVLPLIGKRCVAYIPRS